MVEVEEPVKTTSNFDDISLDDEFEDEDAKAEDEAAEAEDKKEEDLNINALESNQAEEKAENEEVEEFNPEETINKALINKNESETTEEVETEEKNDDSVEGSNVVEEEAVPEEVKEVEQGEIKQEDKQVEEDKVNENEEQEDNAENDRYEANKEQPVEDNEEMVYSDEEDKVRIDDNKDEDVDISSDEQENEEKKNNNYDLFNHLLAFLDTDGELNYVLAGYFSRFLCTIIAHRGFLTIRYLFLEKKETLNRLIDHSSRKSIADVLFKLLTFNITELHSVEKEIKTLIIDRIIESIKATPDMIEKNNNLCEIIFDAMLNKTVQSIVISNPKTFETFTQICLSVRPGTTEYEKIKILTRANDNLIREIPNSVTKKPCSAEEDMINSITNSVNQHNGPSEDFDINDYIHVFETFQYSVGLVNQLLREHNKPEEVLTTFNVHIKKLGLSRLYALEYLKTVVELLINGYALQIDNSLLNSVFMEMINHKLFYQLLEFFENYPLNNTYQKIFENILFLVSNKVSPNIIVDHLMLDIELHNFLMRYISPQEFVYPYIFN